MAVALALPGSIALGQQIPIIGETYAHDPSPVVNDSGNYFYYSTGQGLLSRQSSDLSHWADGPAIFSSPPAWTTTDVPGANGDFWAPDVEYFNNLYHVYYSVSTFGSQVSGIGMATTPTLNPASAGYGWTDHGPVIESSNGSAYNTIDPSVITAANGTMWMSFGSFWNGIYQVQLNPATGMQLTPGATPIHLAQRASGGDTSLEASYLHYHNGYYYLFENWGACCMGVNSTYNVRMGRSTSVNGPFVDQSNVSLLNGGGTLFLGTAGNYIGPGQVGIYTASGFDYLSYHYYNGANNGTPAFAIQNLYWTSNDWPTFIEPLQWSANTSGSTAVDGGGTWDLTHKNFLYNSTNQIWNSSGYGGVTFGAASGPAGTVALAQNVSTSSVTFNASSSGNYTLAGGGFSLNLSAAGTITTNANATISAALSGGAITKQGSATLTLTGPATASNFFFRKGFTVLAGTASLTTATTPLTAANNYSSIGYQGSEIGTLTVMDNASLIVAGDLNVGDTGQGGKLLIGTLNVQNNANVNTRSLFVGKYVNASGTVNQTGGTVQEADNGAPASDWRVGGGSSHGDVSAKGVYNLSGGAFITSSNLQIGAYGNGTLTQTGGGATIGATGSGILSIGTFPGSVGLYDMSAGNGTLNNLGGGNFLVVGGQGTGTLKVGGASMINANGLSIGDTNGGVGTVIQTGGTINLGAGGMEFGTTAASTGSPAIGSFTLSGGTLLTPRITRNQQTTVTGTFNFNGGTLEPTVANSVLIPAGLTHAYVQVGGAIINTNGNNTTITQTLAHDPALGSTPDGGLTKSGSGTLLLAGVETYTGPTTVNAGMLTFGANPGTGIGVRTSGGVAISAAANLSLATNSAHANRTLLITPSLAIAGSTGIWTGRLDLGDNDLIVNNGSLPQVTDQIKTGFNSSSGAWSGRGIITSAAASDTSHLAALGVVQNKDGSGNPLYGAGTTLGLFDGTSPAVSDVIVKYTFFGDANLDGRVDGSDYTLVDNGFHNQLTGWFNGDFNYDGIIDGSDYTLIDNAFNTQASPLSAITTILIASDTAQIAETSVVPEPGGPGGLALMSLAAGISCMLQSRRRRSCVTE